MSKPAHVVSRKKSPVSRLSSPFKKQGLIIEKNMRLGKWRIVSESCFSIMVDSPVLSDIDWCLEKARAIPSKTFQFEAVFPGVFNAQLPFSKHAELGNLSMRVLFGDGVQNPWALEIGTSESVGKMLTRLACESDIPSEKLELASTAVKFYDRAVQYRVICPFREEQKPMPMRDSQILLRRFDSAAAWEIMAIYSQGLGKVKAILDYAERLLRGKDFSRARFWCSVALRSAEKRSEDWSRIWFFIFRCLLEMGKVETCLRLMKNRIFRENVFEIRVNEVAARLKESKSRL